jgi:hypothetical protein
LAAESFTLEELGPYLDNPIMSQEDNGLPPEPEADDAGGEEPLTAPVPRG